MAKFFAHLLFTDAIPWTVSLLCFCLLIERGGGGGGGSGGVFNLENLIAGCPLLILTEPGGGRGGGGGTCSQKFGVHVPTP